MDTAKRVPPRPYVVEESPKKPYGWILNVAKIVGIGVVLCMVWFYLGTPCTNTGDASALKKYGCATGDILSKVGEMLPALLATMQMWLIIGGITGALGPIGAMVAAFYKRKKEWKPNEPMGKMERDFKTKKRDALNERAVELRREATTLREAGEANSAAQADAKDAEAAKNEEESDALTEELDRDAARPGEGGA
jgi:hypothetical protein